MRGVVLEGPRDVRVVDREDPRILDPTDAVIRITATCICGSDLWPYRGDDDSEHQVMGHEYVGVVTGIGDDITTLEVGDHVVGSFVISDNTCETCRAGYQSRACTPSSSRSPSGRRPSTPASRTPTAPW